MGAGNDRLWRWDVPEVPQMAALHFLTDAKVTEAGNAPHGRVPLSSWTDCQGAGANGKHRSPVL